MFLTIKNIFQIIDYYLFAKKRLERLTGTQTRNLVIVHGLRRF